LTSDGRPELTVTEAAKAAGVDRRTIRRRLDAGDFPNARRDDGKQGPDTGPWLLPVEDLLGAGLTLHAPTEPDELTPADTPDPSEVEALRAEVVELRTRAQVAEAVAAERDRVIAAKDDDLRSLRAVLMAGPAVPAATASESPASPPGRPPAAPELPTGGRAPRPTHAEGVARLNEDRAARQARDTAARVERLSQPPTYVEGETLPTGLRPLYAESPKKKRWWQR
jgi:hypothetical protein